MERKTSLFSLLAIGFMLFALFFGAGNLIFPAQLGQLSGDNLWIAAAGFLITGVGLPLLGVLAMAYSGSNNLQDLASRVHPIYGLLFTALLYLTIGPFFAAPRTGTVAYEIGIAPFVSDSFDNTAMLLFTILFFIITLLFSLFPARIVDNVGKILAPALVVLLVFLLVVAVTNPMGSIGTPQVGYESTNEAFISGFLEGYNTMDALASLVFAIIVIGVIKSMGITNQREIFKATAKSGIIAISLLGIIYVGIMYLGATSVSLLGIFETGGPVLNGTASHYFGTFGAIILAIVIILACLTTAIGLIIANAEYFHTIFPRINYKTFVVIFATATFIIANFGLENIIKFSIPMLMFLYPLAIVIIMLAFTSKLFNDERSVYIIAIGVTFCISLFDGLKALTGSLEIEHFNWMNPFIDFYEKILPLYAEGLGWFLPAIVVIVISIAVSFGMRLVNR